MTPDTQVTGIMVTGKTVERFPLAMRAIDAWSRQLFNADHELLIINDHPDVSLFTGSPPRGVREIRVPERHTLGELRNIGIEHANTEYLVQWDDDDISHPSRLLWQVEHTPQGGASVFQYEIHCDMTGEAASFVNNGKTSRCGGFAGTMMWPRECAARFRPLGKHEDTEFLLELKKDIPLVVLQNDPTLYLRCFHGSNTWHREHIMNHKPGSRLLTTAERAYVNQVIQQTRNS